MPVDDMVTRRNENEIGLIPAQENGTILFTREGKHWWLTGFRLGEFSESLQN